uniref:Transposase MuDR plant domain-containing protein n=1 Tax=Lactuca sativa TaxID=4236 RepID=A0A9R1W1M5_LACSA|nr:hypothetical protein LSAT_V11C400218170 [Lactuca sativa]
MVRTLIGKYILLKLSKMHLHTYMCEQEQSCIDLDSKKKSMAMLHMCEEKKEVTIYLTMYDTYASNNLSLSNHLCGNIDEPHVNPECFPSEESYYNHLNSDNEDEPMNVDDEAYSFSKNSLGTKLENIVDYRRALNHYAITNVFDYFNLKNDKTQFTARCESTDYEWKSYVSIMQDAITTKERKLYKVILLPEATKVIISVPLMGGLQI